MSLDVRRITLWEMGHSIPTEDDDEGGFEFGRDLILDGLKRIRGTDPPKS